jgi:hypothetical protein
MSTEYTDDEILDALEAIPAPAPSPPPPRPWPARARWLPVLPWAVAGVLAMVLAAAMLGPLGDARPSPSATVRLGRDFIPRLSGALADGFDAEVETLHAGKSMIEANAALKTAWHKALEKAFEQHAGAVVTAIIPDGKTIENQDQRDRLEAFHRDFARGLRGGR